MEIPRDMRAYRPLPGQTGNSARTTEQPDATAMADRERVSERRRQPDRRQRQAAYQGPDRRRRKDRRLARLLNGRNAKPESLEQRVGRHLSIKA